MLTKRIFISHVLPKQLILEKNQSQAGHNFSYNLIAGKCFDKVYSILPSNINGRIDRRLYEESVTLIYYQKLRKTKVGVLFSLILENIHLQFKLKKNTNVWFYNLSILNVVSFIIVRFFRPSLKAYVIILDYTPDKLVSLQSFYLWLMNKANGTICLSNSKDFTCKNTVCLAGVVPNQETDYPVITKPSKTFLLSGVISERIAMISTLLEVFSLLPECELLISGKIMDYELIKEYENKYPNIHLLGTLSYNEYLQTLHHITFCLSTRNINYPENKNNFPSKIIEHLLHNRIVISTIQYEQLSKLKYFHIPGESEKIKKAIQLIIQLNTETVLQYANQSEKVQASFNVDVWKHCMEKIEKFAD